MSVREEAPVDRVAAQQAIDDIDTIIDAAKHLKMLLEQYLDPRVAEPEE